MTFNEWLLKKYKDNEENRLAIIGIELYNLNIIESNLQQIERHKSKTEKQLLWYIYRSDL